MKEEWRPIPGYQGYEVSSHGRVRSFRKRAKGSGPKWIIAKTAQRILKPATDRTGYLGVNLMLRGRVHHTCIHRLVARAFLGPCPDGMEVCHNDGDSSNNYIGNLRYDSHEANMSDAVEHGSYDNQERYTFSQQQVRAIRAQATRGASFRGLARKYKCSRSLMSSLCRGLIYKKVGGPLAEPRTSKKKLTPEQVIEIRKLCKSTPQNKVARIYNISESMVSRIVHGERRANG